MEFCEKPTTLREYLGDHDKRKEMGAAKKQLADLQELGSLKTKSFHYNEFCSYERVQVD